MGCKGVVHVLTQKPLGDGTGPDLTGDCPVVISFAQNKLGSHLALSAEKRLETCPIVLVL